MRPTADRMNQVLHQLNSPGVVPPDVVLGTVVALIADGTLTNVTGHLTTKNEPPSTTWTVFGQLGAALMYVRAAAPIFDWDTESVFFKFDLEAWLRPLSSVQSITVRDVEVRTQGAKPWMVSPVYEVAFVDGTTLVLAPRKNADEDEWGRIEAITASIRGAIS